MTEGLEINQIIKDGIKEESPNKYVEKLIYASIQYELDIWNRYPPQREIDSNYDQIVDRILKEMKE